MQDYSKNIKPSDVVHDTKEVRSYVISKAKSEAERLKDFTTFKIMWDAGDLSFAPDLDSFDYLHRPNNDITLNLGVINQIAVGKKKSCLPILVKTAKVNIVTTVFRS